jgi:hypothetical protein
MSSPIIPDDGNTVAHIWVNGGTLIDTKGNTWASHGSVPFNAPATVFGRSVEGIGPFSDSDYFTLGTGSDVIDFSGDFTATFIVAGLPPAGNTRYFFCNGGMQGRGEGGYAVGANNSSAEWRVLMNEFSNSTYNSPPVSSSPNIISIGRSGGFGFMKVGAGTELSISGWVPSVSTLVATIGRPSRVIDNGYSWAGQVYEAHFSTSAWSSSAVTARHTAAMTPPPTGTLVSRAGDLNQTYAVGAPDGGITTVRIAYIVPRAKDAPPPDSWLSGKSGHLDAFMNGGLN